MSKLSKRQTILYMAFLILVWGINWPLSKAALQFSPPLLFAGLRTLLGGLILCAVAAPRWRQLRLKSNWIYYAAAGVLNITLYYGLQTVGSPIHAGRHFLRDRIPAAGPAGNRSLVMAG